MAFVSENTLIEARNNVRNFLKKPETFTGLMLLLYCSIDYKFNGFLKKANMKLFSELSDYAFLLNNNDIDTNYSEKSWYALFTTDWLDNVKTNLLRADKLNDNKLPANDFLISLFWYNPYSDIDQLVNQFKSKVGDQVFNSLFFVEDKSNPFTENSPCNRATLYQMLGGKGDHFTVKFDNEFIKKRAGDLSAAPFSQTLYAGNDIKRILTIFDFDISEKLLINSSISKEKPHQILSQSIQLPKPFLLLAGVSGTGKSRFVRKQAEKTGEYQLVAVRPDWHEPSNLLGYVSRLSGKAEYVVTDVLKFIVRAWQAVEKAGLIANNEVCGSTEDLAKVPPYWLCLDEMNLAPVEQYFADYLAVLETREWKWEGEQFRYKTDALLSKASWEGIENFRKDLSISEPLWYFFETKGIGIPFNLIVAGTVNMDETTHAFSRKVLDRALSFDFSKFYPNNFDEFFEPKTQPKLLGYPIASQAVPDEHSAKSIAFLTALNEKLANTPFELAYRALNELLLSVASFKPETDAALQAVWDDFVMTKILPRIEGDENKVDKALENLEVVLKDHLAEIWEGKRPDLWRENIDGSPLEIDCRCNPKLARMKKQLEDRGMVSFW